MFIIAFVFIRGNILDSSICELFFIGKEELMKNAAVYIRVSTDEQVEYSPDSQLIEIKAYAERHGYIIDSKHIYTDAGISGRNAKKRPAFLQMVSEAKMKPSPFDVILVWKFSRFARNQEESILYKSLLKKECNVDVVSITEETGDSMFGSLIERIIEWMDEFYSVRLAEEVTTKMTLAAEQGKVLTIAPFGYLKKPNEPMVIVPDEAEWVRKMFEMHISGVPTIKIARTLNDSGVRTHKGNLFENRTVEYILNNPMYAGYVRWTPTGKTVGKRIYDSPDTIVSKGDFEPIIDYATFEKSKEIFIERKRKYAKASKPSEVKKHWLSGILKCSNCGASLVYSAKHNGFQCHKYSHGFCAVSHFISKRKVEAAVIHSIKNVSITKSFIADITKVKAECFVDYTQQINKLNKMLDRCKLAFAEGIDTLADYAANKKRILSEIAELEEKDRLQREKVVPMSVKEVKDKFYRIQLVLTSDASDDEKREAMLEIVEKIVYSKASDTIDVFFRL